MSKRKLNKTDPLYIPNGPQTCGDTYIEWTEEEKQNALAVYQDRIVRDPNSRLYVNDLTADFKKTLHLENGKAQFTHSELFLRKFITKVVSHHEKSKGRYFDGWRLLEVPKEKP